MISAGREEADRQGCCKEKDGTKRYDYGTPRTRHSHLQHQRPPSGLTNEVQYSTQRWHCPAESSSPDHQSCAHIEAFHF